MGACGSKEEKEKLNSKKEKYQEAKVPVPTPIHQQPGQNVSATSFNPVQYDHIIANKGNANQDYTLINPPLGAGAFGEVRKAIHKASGIERAIKIIYKAKADPEELSKIKSEVTIIFFILLMFLG